MGKYFSLTHYVDTNIFHEQLTGRYVTGLLHLVSKTPVNWYPKKQGTLKTAIYCYEFVTFRTCVEEIIDLWNTLQYLGVPICHKYTFLEIKICCWQYHILVGQAT